MDCIVTQGWGGWAGRAAGATIRPSMPAIQPYRPACGACGSARGLRQRAGLAAARGACGSARGVRQRAGLGQGESGNTKLYYGWGHPCGSRYSVRLCRYVVSRDRRDTAQGVPRYGAGGSQHGALRDDTVRDTARSSTRGSAETQGHNTVA